MQKLILAAISTAVFASFALAPKAVGQQPQRATFTNPVLWADVPDPDVIRVDSDFYLVSTTMHLMPGAPVMRSRDLVNWQTVAYLFDSIADNSRYRLEGGTVYGKGQWATSLRYHDGKYWALFSPNDEPYRAYLYTTDDPAGRWMLHSRLPHFHDASLFFDDDGRAYVFSGTGRLNELNATLTGLKDGGVDTTVITHDAEENALLEGSRVIKHDGRYYLLMVSWPSDGPRRQLCYRADNITGPYEKRIILMDQYAGFPYVGQGTIVDGPDGQWYGLIFQDRGGVGRVPLLMPCRWEDGWPMLGDADGRVPARVELPFEQCEEQVIVTSDDFGSDSLDMRWQWNHIPIHGAWSLSERPGWLRLRTPRIVDNVYEAPNTITQRMEGPTCSAYIEMDVTAMNDGDRAGLMAFNGHSGIIAIEKDGQKLNLTVRHQLVNLSGDRQHAVTSVDDSLIVRQPISVKKIWLRVDGDFRLGRDIATFAYSVDGQRWTYIGGEFQMRFDYTRLFMGTRYAIFNYATKQTGGHVDINEFVYSKERH